MHPETTLTKVLEKVNGAVTLCQSFIGHVPDSPFPARSFVQGLAYLLQLGYVRQVLIPSIDHLTICLQTIASAKKDVYDFTTLDSQNFTFTRSHLVRETCLNCRGFSARLGTTSFVYGAAHHPDPGRWWTNHTSAEAILYRYVSRTFDKQCLVLRGR